ncbi:hypothetical protein NONO_c11000 [Nocardia nova SH22a]|uniref:Uncharacterized protein n=1 Tax=Nocardia nova SH22a TaxID=1415166 RepID=W5T9N8_9NOCA|nr:hypothetical protein NONO_c11000 [Nocardia nova SH22a]
MGQAFLTESSGKAYPFQARPYGLLQGHASTVLVMDQVSHDLMRS